MISKRDGLALIFFMGLSCAAGAIGSIATASAVTTWYATLAKPAWTPPNWVFGPVWTALYLLMANAAWLVWRGRSVRSAIWPLGFFVVQLVLNALWSFMFFGMHQPLAAFVELVVLWIAILVTLILFARASKVAGWLMAPYLLWVTYAGTLNFAIWRLNH